MLVHSFILKQTSYHKRIQASEQKSDVGAKTILIFKYHAHYTVLSIIQKFVVSKSAFIVEEREGKAILPSYSEV
jgi:hypothetical protein